MTQKQLSYITEKEVFPTRLRELMKKHNLTQEALANETGIARTTIGAYRTGQRTPHGEKLVKLANRFDVSADWLLGISDVKKVDAELASVCTYTGLSENAVMHLRTNENARNIINLLLENEYMITKKALNTAGNISVDGAVIGAIYRYLTIDIPKTLAYVNDSGEVMAVDGASSPLDWVGKGELIEMDRVAERIALDDVMRSVELLKAAYQQRKDAE